MLKKFFYIPISLAILLIGAGIFAFSTTDKLEMISAKELAQPKVVNTKSGISPPSHFPPTKVSTNEPNIQSVSGLIFHLESSTTLESKNSEKKLAIASLTKLMTSVVALEKIPMDKTITVPSYIGNVEGSKMFLKVDEKIKLGTLVEGMLISSANDAARSIEYYFNQDTSRNLFTEEMNAKAEVLNMNNTNFDNPVGFDSDNNYSTATDLKKLVRFALSKEKIKETVNTKDKSVYSEDSKYYHYLKNTNDLLIEGIAGVNGVKTGTTDLAGRSVIISAKVNEQNTIVIILLNSPDRFGEAQELLLWTKANYKFN